MKYEGNLEIGVAHLVSQVFRELGGQAPYIGESSLAIMKSVISNLRRSLHRSARLIPHC